MVWLSDPYSKSSERYDNFGDYIEAGASNILGQDVVDGIKTGLSNWWYTLTGQTEKTSAYQNLMEREDTAYQRAVADMQAAGLSKYQGVNPASSTSAPNANMSALDKIQALQKVKAQKIANDEAEEALDEKRYNLGISKQLGIRTGDQNFASKWATLGNVLFGFDPTNVEGGLIPWVFERLSSFLGSDSGSGSSSGSKNVDTPSLVGASADQVKSIAEDMNRLASEGPEAVERFVEELITNNEFGENGGSVLGYKTIPKSVVKQFSAGVYEDVEHFKKELASKGLLMDDYTVDRIAEFIANRYGEEKAAIFKMLRGE